MKIALVWPHGFDPKYVFPLTIGYLKSNISPTHELLLIDCSLDNIPTNSPRFRKLLEDFKPDLVGTTCWSPTYKSAVTALEVAKSINPKTTTVIGGVHPTSYPEFILNTEKSIDFLFRGECDLSFPAFVDELEFGSPNFSKIKGLMFKDSSGQFVMNETEREPDLDKIKLPDYKATRLQEYLQAGYKYATTHDRNAPIWVTRGCPYRCSFCSAPTQNGRVIRKHSVQYVVDWIKKLYFEENVTHINIIDDNFTFFMPYAKEFCQSFIDLNLKNLTFGTPNGIRMQRLDEELLHLMKKAGWENLCVAPESGSVHTLERMKKDLKPDVVPPIVKMIQKAGLKVHGFFILGYPGDTKEDLRASIELLRKCNFDFFYLHNFQALPGTPVFDELVEKGEIPPDFLPKNYSDGARSYTPPDLRDVNVRKLILGEYIRLFIKSARKFVYTMKYLPPKLVAKKVFNNMKNIGRDRTGDYGLTGGDDYSYSHSGKSLTNSANGRKTENTPVLAGSNGSQTNGHASSNPLVILDSKKQNQAG